MPAHQRVRAWVAQNYQRPVIDQEWLADCADWISSELNFNPDRDFDQFIQHVEAQLLQSNLADSTVPSSGIDPRLITSVPVCRPTRRFPRQEKSTGPTPLLVEIKSITEIAHSAFSLLNTYQTRLDRADLGLARDDNMERPRDDDDDDGPVPRFPRGMLRFELSDGLTTFRAIEFRSLPQLELGTTPLGYKLLLKSTPIRNGVAFLEPGNVVLKGYRTEDHDINNEQIFLSSLRRRLGRPDPPSEVPAGQPQVIPPDQPVNQPRVPPFAPSQFPPSAIDDMCVDDEVDPDVLREMFISMDELDARENGQAIVCNPPTASTSKAEYATKSDTKATVHDVTTIASTSVNGPWPISPAKTSSYFTTTPKSKPVPDIGLSPNSAPPRDPQPDFDVTRDMGSTESSDLSAKKHGVVPATKRVVPSKKRPLSPDPLDDLSFDMVVNELFLEQVGMIEQDALVKRVNNKGKRKDIITETSTMSHKVADGKVLQASASSTKRSNISFVSPSGAECSTRTQSNTKRDSTSSLSGSMETPIPQSTQSSDRRLPRDPSLIVISSEDETPGDGRTARSLDHTRSHANKGKGTEQDLVADLDVIDISD